MVISQTERIRARLTSNDQIVERRTPTYPAPIGAIRNEFRSHIRSYSQAGISGSRLIS
jgi:hypothetical protein